MGKQKDRESGFLFFPLRRGLRPLSLSELAAFPAACPLPSRAATGLEGWLRRDTLPQKNKKRWEIVKAKK